MRRRLPSLLLVRMTVMAVFLVLYSGASMYGYYRGILPAPYRLYLVLVVLSVFSVLGGHLGGWVRIAREISSVIFVVLIFMLLATGSAAFMLGFGVESEAMEQWRSYAYFSVSLLLFAVLFHTAMSNGVDVGFWFLVTGVATAILVLVDFQDPFLLWGEEAYDAGGRARGLFKNPNVAGITLLMCLIFGLGRCPPVWRLSYVALIAGAVFTTLSRGTLIPIVMTILAFLLMGRIKLRPSILGTVPLILLAVAGVFLGEQVSEEWTSNPNVEIRLAFLSMKNAEISESDAVRIEAALEGWRLFSEHPILGKGIGSAAVLNVTGGQSTHNQFLYLMVEFGFLGALLFPLMVWICARPRIGDPESVIYFGCMMMLGFVSHNLMDNPLVAVPLAYAAARTFGRSGGRHRLGSITKL